MVKKFKQIKVHHEPVPATNKMQKSVICKFIVFEKIAFSSNNYIFKSLKLLHHENFTI